MRSVLSWVGLLHTRVGSLTGWSESLYGPRVPGGTGRDPSREASRRTGGNLPSIIIIITYRASTYSKYTHPLDVWNPA